MASLPAGFAGSEFRSTETRVFSVAEGSGEARIGHSTYGFARHDVFVVPGWTPYRLSAKTQCLLFSYSDRAAQELLGFYRESFATAFS
jgi:gentisate 1,2-dioxygenase